jgi:SAM-dependent methyltransferase
MTAALYDSVIADFYDASPVVVSRQKDVVFYRDAARRYGGPVLELGCGTGRITMAIAEAGQQITGLDNSEKMLQRATQKVAVLRPEQRQRVTLLPGDMRRFALDQQFQSIIIPFRPFQHLLPVPEQLDCLGCVRQHLALGGKLIMDFFQTDAARMHDPQFLKEHFIAEYEMSGGRKVRLSERIAAFHRAEQCNDVEMAFEVTGADGSTTRNVFAFTFRYFFRYEVEHLLARSGFRVMESWGDFDRSELKDDSPEMIFVAEST